MNREKVVKRRAREAQFARKTVTKHALIALALCVLVAILMMIAPGILRRGIDKALERRDFERARSIADVLGEDETALTEKKILYVEGEDALTAREYERAKGVFQSLGDFEDAPIRVSECVYRRADFAFGEGRYEDALTDFSAVPAYEDALNRANVCRYRLAENDYLAGKVHEAFEKFEALGAFMDSRERMTEIAREITGIEDGEAALNAAMGLTPEEMDRLNRLAERRETLKTGWIAVGYRHTVARTQDGHVLAAGSNEKGQTDVREWKNIVAVSAGAYHTVALQADGTVLSTGDNEYGQCEVADWRNVTGIACGAFDTYGLTSDGIVLHAGFSENSSVESLRGINMIFAGAYVAGGLTDNGTMVSTSAHCALGDSAGWICADVCSGYAAGVKRDGSVQATFGELNWNDAAVLSCGGAGVLGIDGQGRVLSHFFRESEKYDFDTLTEAALAVCAGGGHHAVLLGDGTVRVFGKNDEGQAETETWNLFETP